MMRNFYGWGLLAGVASVTGCLQIIGYEDARTGWTGPGGGGSGTGGMTSSSSGGGGTGGVTDLCSNDVRDGDETGTDCGGGTCPACPLGEGCIVGTDCESLACSPGHICVPALCNDMVQNAGESDIDCGGPDCSPCAVGLKCNQPEDCVSLACDGGICTGECTPGDKQCSGNIPQTCNATWHWDSGEACEGATPQCCDAACLAAAAEITSGSSHVCARRTDGTLWCWGFNFSGQLGIGTTTQKPSPVQVTAQGTGVAEIAARMAHMCARRTDGTLWCWGSNGNGELGDGTTLEKRSSPVQVTALGMSVSQVGVGNYHTCARKTDGTLWCWGNNGSGRLGDGTTANKSTPVQVTSLGTSVAQVAPGWEHTCARKADNTLWCWGNNGSGQLGNGTVVNSSSPVQVVALGTNVADVVAGYYHTCARKTDGTLWCWGNNGSGRLGDGSMVSSSSPVQVVALGANVVEVAASAEHTCARKTDNSLWCWGNNGSGRLGDGTLATNPSPVQVTALGANVAEIAAGAEHTCARKSDDSLWCWGKNASGQLGDGTTLSPWISPKRLSLGACEMDDCGSGAKDGDETDVDCGGPTCNALGKTCWDGNACGGPEDCASTVCVGGTCQAQ